MTSESDQPTVLADMRDALHDAVFDATAWERMISIIGYSSPELRPMLQVEARGPFEVLLTHYHGWDPDLIAFYAEHYVDRNAFRPHIDSIGIGVVGISTEAITERELMASPFYADVLSRNGDIRAASGFVFARTPQRDARFGFHYGGSDYGEAMQRGVALQEAIVDEMRAAFGLAMRAASLSADAHVSGAIDTLAIPALVLDGQGRMIRANRLATPLVEHDEALYLTGKGELMGVGRHDNQRLEAAFLSATHEQRMVVCPFRGAGGRHVTAHFVPMKRKEATDPLIASFIDTIEPSAIVYLRMDHAG